jgi:hypothetical protein
MSGVAGAIVQLSRRPDKESEPGGIRTRDALIKRYLALSGVATRTARGAKVVRLSSGEIVLQTLRVNIWRSGLGVPPGLRARNSPTPASIPVEIRI